MGFSRSATAQDLVLRNANGVDVTNDSIRSGATVVVTDGRIVTPRPRASSQRRTSRRSWSTSARVSTRPWMA
ncbi:MAG: hypothetical protein WD995_10580, partial [Gemmatimonadota bacterium]